MRAPTDIHPDDLAARERIARELTDSREQVGYTPAQLAKALGVTRNTALAVEQRTTWAVSTLQAAARARGRRLRMTLAGIAVPDDFDILTVVYAIADRSTPERDDHVHLRTVCNDLVRIRYCITTARTVGERIGISEAAVLAWEGAPDASSVSVVQRYARALTSDLSSRIDLSLLPAPLHIPAQRPAA